MPQQIMIGKRVLITGANSGIGKATATELARAGAEVIIVGRNQVKNRAAVAEIQATTGNSRVSALTADLSLMADVRRFASEVLRNYDRLDVLINNVGGVYSKRHETGEGMEASLAINFLGPILLSRLLLPALEKSEQGRIVNLNSSAHRFAKLDLEDLQAQKWYRGLDIYGRAKLLNLLASYEMARQLKGTRISVNSVDPGGANTEMQNGITSEALPPFMRVLFPVLKLLSQRVFTTQKAAVSSVIAATSSELAEVSGVYLNTKGKIARSSKISYNTALAGRVWQIALKLTEETTAETPVSSVQTGYTELGKTAV